MSCGVGHRCSLDPNLLWLWCRPAAVALIRPLAGELPYAVGVALKRREKKPVKSFSLVLFMKLLVKVSQTKSFSRAENVGV